MLSDALVLTRWASPDIDMGGKGCGGSSGGGKEAQTTAADRSLHLLSQILTLMLAIALMSVLAVGSVESTTMVINAFALSRSHS